MATAAATSVDHLPDATLDDRAEIRKPTPDEQERAWILQREAFSLEDPDAPHPGSCQEPRVVVRAGNVVSCLTLIHGELFIRGASVSMGGVRHVATDPNERNQGYASALVRDTLRELRRTGCHTSVLFPFSFRYYRKFGYELGGNHCQFWCRPGCIPAYQDRRACRRATATDVPRLAEFYRRRHAHSSCALMRSRARWEQIFGESDAIVLIAECPEVAGYAVLREARDAYGGRVLRIQELTASSRGGWRALLGHLAQTQAESVEWCASSADLVNSGLMRSPAPLREGFKPRGVATVRPMFQFRVVDLEGALRAVLPAAPDGSYRLGIRVEDDLLPENSQPLTICANGSQRDVRPARPADPFLELDVRIFSQIFCGYLSPEEAVSQGLARCSSPAAVETAERLFWPGEPFLSELDRF